MMRRTKTESHCHEVLHGATVTRQVSGAGPWACVNSANRSSSRQHQQSSWQTVCRHWPECRFGAPSLSEFRAS